MRVDFEVAFGPEFQRRLSRVCMDDPVLRGLLSRFVQKGQVQWSDPTAGWLWAAMQADEHVSRLRLETEARRLPNDHPARMHLSTVLTMAPDWRDDNYVRQQVVEWARTQVFYEAFEEARTAWNAKDLNTAQRVMLSRIEEMNALSLTTADRGWFFEEAHERQDRRLLDSSAGEYFPCGVDVIDDAMNGGLHLGELEVPIAYSGIGKTFWCVQRGFIGARLRQRVLHIVLEGGRKKTEDRYEARWTDTLYRDVKHGAIDFEAFEAALAEYEMLKGNLVVRGSGDEDAWSADFAFILRELEDLRRTRGWVPKLIVVDYGDLLNEDGKDDRERQKSAYRKLKHLSERIEYPGHRGYAVCSPSQAQRPDKGADEREHVLLPRDIADCYEKVRVADAILSLNRTNAEKAARLARVHLGKYRDDEDGMTARVRTAYEKGAFCVIGGAEPPPPAPPIPGTTPPPPGSGAPAGR